MTYISRDKRITLYNGDCEKVIPTIKKCDCFITSPPYNIGLKYNSYDDNRLDYMDFMATVFSSIKRRMTTGGSFFLNVGSQNKDPFFSYKLATLASNFFKLQNHVIWCKSIYVDKSRGHYKPINSKRFLNNIYEDIFHFTHTGDIEINRLAIGVPYTDKNNMKRRSKNKDVKCRGNVWFVPYDTRVGKHSHPGTFPVSLAEMCIKLSNAKRVCDPFMGTGTVGVAAKSLNKSFTGIEIDKKYYKIAKDRINETG